MGAAHGDLFAGDSIPVIFSLLDVHNARARDEYYFANVSTGGTLSKVIGRGQSVSVEVVPETVIHVSVYECPEPVFTPEYSYLVGRVDFPLAGLQNTSGVFARWFDLDCSESAFGRAKSRLLAEMNGAAVAGGPGAGSVTASGPQQERRSGRSSKVDHYNPGVRDVYSPKVCVSILGTSWQVARRGVMDVFVEEVPRTVGIGPDVRALVESHKQQAQYIDMLHEELRRLNMPSYRPVIIPSSSGGRETIQERYLKSKGVTNDRVDGREFFVSRATSFADENAKADTGKRATM